MKSSLRFSAADVYEAVRPRSSGPSVNVHVVRGHREIVPNYNDMREQILGEKPDGEAIVEEIKELN